MTISHDELLDIAEKHARHTLIFDQEPELVPIWHLFNADGASMVCSTPWTNTQEKEIIFRMLKKKAREMNAVSAVFISGVRIVDTDIKEIVFAFATDKTTTSVRSWDIVRRNGRIIDLIRLTPPGEGAFNGFLIDGLLP